MRVLVLAPQPFFQNRGTPIAVKLLCEVLVEGGHQVEVLAYHEGEDPGLPGVAVHRIQAPSWVRGIRPGLSWQKIVCDLYMLGQASQLLASRRYDLVHAVEESAFLAMWLQRRHGLPYVYDMDSSLAQQVVEKLPALAPLAKLLAWCEGRAVGSSLGVVAVCQALAQLANGHGGGKPVLLLEDISLLAAADGQPALEERLDLPGLGVLYVGNLEAYQGMGLLLEGLALAVRQGGEISLAVIGGEAADIRKYQDRANTLGLAGRVRFLGPRPAAHLAHYLGQAQVLASPRTKGNNTPMKIYSYLDSGRAVLATRLPTHTQALDDQVAMLVEPTPQDMAQGLLRLAQDPELRQALGQRGRQRAQERHSRQAFARKLLGFYGQLESTLTGGPGGLVLAPSAGAASGS